MHTGAGRINHHIWGRRDVKEGRPWCEQTTTGTAACVQSLRETTRARAGYKEGTPSPVSALFSAPLTDLARRRLAIIRNVQPLGTRREAVTSGMENC